MLLVLPLLGFFHKILGFLGDLGLFLGDLCFFLFYLDHLSSGFISNWDKKQWRAEILGSPGPTRFLATTSYIIIGQRFLDARGRANPKVIFCPKENLHFPTNFSKRFSIRLPKFLTIFSKSHLPTFSPKTLFF